MDEGAAQDVWRRAADFAALCDAGARFLDGELPFFPGWMAADIDDETDDIADVLAACCRGGFLTTASQPGLRDGFQGGSSPQGQRAFVMGFARPEVAATLAGLAVGTPLFVANFATVDAGPASEVPVGRHADEPYLFAGGAFGPAELEIFTDQVPESALAELRGMRAVSVVDLEWGRDDLLWPALAGVFGERV